MAEYIEKGAAIEAAKHAWAKGLEPSQYIETIPAADVAPVVRCKECKHWYSSQKNGLGKCLKLSFIMGDTSFCSYGERRDGDGND